MAGSDVDRIVRQVLAPTEELLFSEGFREVSSRQAYEKTYSGLSLSRLTPRVTFIPETGEIVLKPALAVAYRAIARIQVWLLGETNWKAGPATFWTNLESLVQPDRRVTFRMVLGADSGPLLEQLLGAVRGEALPWLGRLASDPERSITQVAARKETAHLADGVQVALALAALGRREEADQVLQARIEEFLVKGDALAVETAREFRERVLQWMDEPGSRPRQKP